jgi:hypothetical protein
VVSVWSGERRQSRQRLSAVSVQSQHGHVWPGAADRAADTAADRRDATQPHTVDRISGQQDLAPFVVSLPDRSSDGRGVLGVSPTA